MLTFPLKVSSAQNSKISLSSSTNFKAMEEFDFDVTCQFDGEESVSIEFVLPNGDRAANNSFLSLSKPWKTNSLQLKIESAEWSRDKGFYKCIVNDSEAELFSMDFYSNEFIKISTPNPVIRITKSINSTFDMIIEVVAFPFPHFVFYHKFIGYSGVYAESVKQNYDSRFYEIMIRAKNKISPTQYKMTINAEELVFSGEYTFTITANNTEQAASCTYNITYVNDGITYSCK